MPSRKPKPPKDLDKIRERAAKAHRELKEAEAQAINYYNSIVAGAVKTAIKKGGLPRKLFDNILDKYVTDKSDRKFMGIDSPESSTDEVDNSNSAPDPDTTNTERLANDRQHHDQNGHQHEYQNN